MLNSKQEEIDRLIDQFIKKNFEYQSVLNSVLAMNRKLVHKRIKDAQKLKKKENKQFFEWKKKNTLKRTKRRSKARVNSLNNVSIKQIKKPGFFEIFRNSFSFIDVSEYSDESSVKFYNLNSQFEAEGEEQKEREKPNLRLSFMNKTEVKKSKASSVKSFTNSVKLKDLSLKNSQKVEVFSETPFNANNLSVQKIRKSEKISFTPSRKSDDLFNNPKRINSQGNSDYLTDTISGISSVSQMRKISFNDGQIDSTKTN